MEDTVIGTGFSPSLDEDEDEDVSSLSVYTYEWHGMCEQLATSTLSVDDALVNGNSPEINNTGGLWKSEWRTVSQQPVREMQW
jgi:hypothetical protein